MTAFLSSLLYAWFLCILLTFDRFDLVSGRDLSKKPRISPHLTSLLSFIDLTSSQGKWAT